MDKQKNSLQERKLQQENREAWNKTQAVKQKEEADSQPTDKLAGQFAEAAAGKRSDIQMEPARKPWSEDAAEPSKKEEALLRAALSAQLQQEYAKEANKEQEIEHTFSPEFKACIAELIANAGNADTAGKAEQESKNRIGLEKENQTKRNQSGESAKTFAFAQQNEKADGQENIIQLNELEAWRSTREAKKQAAARAQARMAGKLAARNQRRKKMLMQAASVLFLFGIGMFGARQVGLMGGAASSAAVSEARVGAEAGGKAFSSAPEQADKALKSAETGQDAGLQQAGRSSETGSVGTGAGADARGNDAGESEAAFSRRMAEADDKAPLAGTQNERAAGQQSQNETAVQAQAEGENSVGQGAPQADAAAPAAAAFRSEAPADTAEGTDKSTGETAGNNAAGAVMGANQNAETGAADGEKAAFADGNETEHAQIPNPIQEVSGTDAFAEKLGFSVPFSSENRSGIRYSIIGEEIAQINYYSERLQTDVTYRAAKTDKLLEEGTNKNSNAGESTAADADEAAAQQNEAVQVLSGVYANFDESRTETWLAQQAGESIPVTVRFQEDGSGTGTLASWQHGGITYTLWAGSAGKTAKSSFGEEAAALAGTKNRQ